MQHHGPTYYAFAGASTALALIIRYKRGAQTRRLRLGTLWIVPAIFIALAAALLAQSPPSGLGWLWVALGFAVGAAIGWWRAGMVEVGIDLETGQLQQRSSAGAIVFLAGLMLARQLLRFVVAEGDAYWHFGAMLIADISITLAVGALSFYRIELYLRARHMRRSA